VGIARHRIETFKFSTDPGLNPRSLTWWGAYLDPPENAVVVSVDEKSRIQALDRTAPDAAAAARPSRAPHPRLRAARHRHPVRCAGGHPLALLIHAGSGWCGVPDAEKCS
jgi:hypothetical protein